MRQSLREKFLVQFSLVFVRRNQVIKKKHAHDKHLIRHAFQIECVSKIAWMPSSNSPGGTQQTKVILLAWKLSTSVLSTSNRDSFNCPWNLKYTSFSPNKCSVQYCIWSFFLLLFNYTMPVNFCATIHR